MNLDLSKYRGEDKRQHECLNCAATWTTEQLHQPIRDFEERVIPGDEMPSGECPECGALCFPFGEGERPVIRTGRTMPSPRAQYMTLPVHLVTEYFVPLTNSDAYKSTAIDTALANGYRWIRTDGNWAVFEKLSLPMRARANK